MHPFRRQAWLAICSARNDRASACYASASHAPEPHTHSRGCHQRALRMGWTTWWPWRGARTRSHPELGRENPQRPWYCASRHGRVGRRQVFQPIPPSPKPSPNAGWSSPVARQAHNLKAAGSNPAPATKFFDPTNKINAASNTPSAGGEAVSDLCPKNARCRASGNVRQVVNGQAERLEARITARLDEGFAPIRIQMRTGPG